MTKIIILVFVLICTGVALVNAQSWEGKLSQGRTSFFEIQKQFYEENALQMKSSDSLTMWRAKKDLKKFKRFEWIVEPRVYPSGDMSLISKTQENFNEYNFHLQQRRLSHPDPNINRTMAANWSIVGPTTLPQYGYMGRVNAIRFDPTNSNTIWVCAPSGGLWKSTDAGATWTTNTDLLSVIGCTDLAIDPTNTNIMYLATGDGYYTACNSTGILKSIDGGVTWQATGLAFTVNQVRKIRKLLMHPTNPSILLAATNDGLFKTTNGAVSWSRTLTGDVSDIKYKPTDPTVVYAVTKDFSCTFYKSTNGGDSFGSTATGLPAPLDVRRYVIGVTPANVNYVYLVACNTSNTLLGVYRSTNSGGSFALRANSPDIVSAQGYYNLSIAVSPTNANHVFAGGVDLWSSTNGGTTWNTRHGTHPDHHALEFLPGNGTTIFTGNDGGIFKSTNNGANWVDLSGGLAISQMYRLGVSNHDPEVMLAGTQDNGTFKRTHDTWNNIYGGDGMEAVIDHTVPNIWYVATQNGLLSKSIDTFIVGGHATVIAGNWGAGVDAPSSWVTPFVMHPTDHNTLLIGKRHVFRTTDGGASWTQAGSIAGSDPYMRALAYAPSNPNYIYAAFAYNFWVSTGGDNFINRNDGLPVLTTMLTYITVSKTDPNKVWVTCSGYDAGKKVYQSNDAGVTWINYSTGLPNLPVNCITYQEGPNDALYVGTDVGVYYRDNTMANWEPYSTGLPNVMISELEINEASGKLRAATYGRGLWETPVVAQAPACTPPINTWLGIINTAWENPLNWSCNIVPDANTDVIINNGTVAINSNVTIKSLTIKPGVNFSVGSGFKLTVSE